MRRLMLILALALPVSAFGQTFSAGGRAAAGVDCKLAKGLHVSVEEEVRSGDNFSKLGSLRTDVSFSYKPFKYLKIGAGYTLINPYKAGKEIITPATVTTPADTSYYSGFWSPRHRVYADVSGHYKLGLFSFSIKERIQFTHNTDTGINPYQTTRNALASKTKLGVKYTGFLHVTPEVAFEVRAALNDPWGTASGTELYTSKTKKAYYSYQHTGYTHAYIDRLRLNLGAEIELSRNHTLEPYVLLDYNMDYVIDTNSPSKWATEDGVRIFSATTGWQYGFGAIVGLNYKFSF